MKQIKHRILPLLAALCLLLCGCRDGNQLGVSVITTGDGGASAEDAGSGEDPPAPEGFGSPEDPAEAENLFERIPRDYIFCSGAGGWSTELSLEPDGSFTGMYHDSDMGDLDQAKYPNGTVYLCQFRGQFAQPEAVDETTWTMKLESLELDHPADEAEEFADGMRFIYSEPFGLEDTEALTVYLPDTPAEELDEDVLWAVQGPYGWNATEAGTLGLTILYNAAQDHGFVQIPIPAEVLAP